MTKKLGLSVTLDDMLKVLDDISDVNSEHVDLFNEFSEICTIEIEDILEDVFESGTNLHPDTTLPLYLAGFNGSEIAGFRKTSRQLTLPKIKNQYEAAGFTTLDEVRAVHKQNRYKLYVIVAKWYVSQVEKTKDLSIMDEVLNNTYTTKRSKYKAYVALGGDPDLFEPEEIDKRMLDITKNPVIEKAYELFKDGKTNQEVATELNIDSFHVQKYRRAYYRRNSNVNDMLNISK